MTTTEYNIFDSLLQSEKFPTFDEMEKSFLERIDELELSANNYIDETRREFNLSIESERIAAGM
jgi:hypothetical protein